MLNQFSLLNHSIYPLKAFVTRGREEESVFMFKFHKLLFCLVAESIIIKKLENVSLSIIIIFGYL